MPATPVGVVDEVVVVDEVAVVVEAVVVVEEAEAVVGVTMTTETQPHCPWWDPPGVDVDESIKFSTMPRCSISRRKSYKINAKQLQVDALRVSPPPTPSQRPTKTDDDPP